MPRKIFVAGEILTAADVNTNLMDQAVMVFDDPTARGSAIPSPSEGMVTYLKDTDELEKYSGTAWLNLAPAAIGPNVVQTVKTDTFSTSSTTFTDVTGLTVTITPSSATAKVLVIANVNFGQNFTSAGQSAFLRLNGGNASNFVGNTAGNRSRVASGFTQFMNTSTPNEWFRTVTLVYLDSPNTASPVTYAVQGRLQGGSTFYVNRVQEWNDLARSAALPSSISAIEVAS